MGIEVQIKKFVICSLKTCYRCVHEHPLLVGMLCFLIFMCRFFPFVFSLLVSASPVLISTAVLLGTLLSFGQPEIENEEKTTHDIVSLRSEVPRDDIVLADNSVGETSLVSNNIGEFDDDDNLVDSDEDEMYERGFELASQLDGENQHHLDEENDYSQEGSIDSRMVETELCEKGYELVRELGGGNQHNLDEESDNSQKGSMHSRTVEMELLEKEFELVRELDGENQSNLDEENDNFQKGSIDSRMVETEVFEKGFGHARELGAEDQYNLDDEKDNSQKGLMNSRMVDIELCEKGFGQNSELNKNVTIDGEFNENQLGSDNIQEENEYLRKGLIDFGLNEYRLHDGEFDENQYILIPQYDNDLDMGNFNSPQCSIDSRIADLLSLNGEGDDQSEVNGTDDEFGNKPFELERNKRVENLMDRRRGRKNLRLMAEKNLIDLENDDFSFNISPIYTTRHNNFSFPSTGNIPMSAPSILLPRQNPFNIPFTSIDEEQDSVRDAFQQESKEFSFRKYESFNARPSVFKDYRLERSYSSVQRHSIENVIVEHNQETVKHVFGQKYSSGSSSSSLEETEKVYSIKEDEGSSSSHVFNRTISFAEIDSEMSIQNDTPGNEEKLVDSSDEENVIEEISLTHAKDSSFETQSIEDHEELKEQLTIPTEPKDKEDTTHNRIVSEFQDFTLVPPNISEIKSHSVIGHAEDSLKEVTNSDSGDEKVGFTDFGFGSETTENQNLNVQNEERGLVIEKNLEDPLREEVSFHGWFKQGAEEKLVEKSLSESDNELPLYDKSMDELSLENSQEMQEPLIIEIESTGNVSTTRNLNVPEVELDNEVEDNDQVFARVDTQNNVEDIDGIDEIDEGLLMELDAVGDFSIEDSTGMRVLEAKSLEDINSAFKKIEKEGIEKTIVFDSIHVEPSLEKSESVEEHLRGNNVKFDVGIGQESDKSVDKPYLEKPKESRVARDILARKLISGKMTNKSPLKGTLDNRSCPDFFAPIDPHYTCENSEGTGFNEEIFDVDICLESHEKFVFTDNQSASQENVWSEEEDELFWENTEESQMESMGNVSTTHNLNVSEVQELNNRVEVKNGDRILVEKSTHYPEEPTDSYVGTNEDGLKGTDEGLLSELEPIGDFYIKDSGSNSNETGMHVLEAKSLEDIDLAFKKISDDDTKKPLFEPQETGNKNAINDDIQVPLDEVNFGDGSLVEKSTHYPAGPTDSHADAQNAIEDSDKPKEIDEGLSELEAIGDFYIKDSGSNSNEIGMHVLEAKSLEDIDLAFKQISSENEINDDIQVPLDEVNFGDQILVEKSTHYPATDSHVDAQNAGKDDDKLKEIDEGGLSELDAFGDFYIKDSGSNSNESGMHVLEAKSVEDIDFAFKKISEDETKNPIFEPRNATNDDFILGESREAPKQEVKQSEDIQVALDEGESGDRIFVEKSTNDPAGSTGSEVKEIDEWLSKLDAIGDNYTKDPGSNSSKIGMHVVEAKSLDDIDLAFKQINEDETKKPLFEPKETARNAIKDDFILGESREAPKQEVKTSEN